MLMNVMKFDKFPLSLSPLDSKFGFVPIIIAHVVLFLAHGTLLYISKSWNIEFRTCLVKRKKNGVFSINFQFFVGPTTKKPVWLCFYTQYSFSVKKNEFKYKKWIQLLAVFIFSENEYNGILVKTSSWWGPND